MKFKSEPKVLLMSPLPPPIGGIASWSVNLLNYFQENDFKNIYHINTSIKLRRITSSNKTIRIISGLAKFILIFIELLFHLLFKKKDIIHLTSSASLGLFSDFSYITIANIFRVPVITHWRFGRIPSLAKQNNWEWKLLLLVIKKSKVAIVIDQNSYQTLLNFGFTHIKNIPNPISKRVEEKAIQIQQDENLKPTNKILFVGHVVREKGIFELVNACLHLPIVKELVVVGPYEHKLKLELETIAKQRDSRNWLRMEGPKNNDQVLEYMQQFPILAIPSYSEGFPNVVIEAMAMGCAIIATNVGAIPEILNDKSNRPCGICIPVRDTDSLKQAITIYVNQPQITKMIGNNGVKRVLNTYTLSSISMQYLDIWRNTSTK